MATGIKFNDPAGDADQQKCHNACDIIGAKTGIGRVDCEGTSVDIYYLPDGEGGFGICNAPGKCLECPYLANHVST